MQSEWSTNSHKISLACDDITLNLYEKRFSFGSSVVNNVINCVNYLNTPCCKLTPFQTKPALTKIYDQLGQFFCTCGFFAYDYFQSFQ